MKKIYCVCVVVGVLLSFFSEKEIQKQRSLIFTTVFLILTISIYVGEKIFSKKTNDLQALLLLFLSIIIGPIGFPLIYFAAEPSMQLVDFFYSYLLMLLIGIFIYIYTACLRKYLKKIINQQVYTIVAIASILILLFIPALLIYNENYLYAFLYSGSLCFFFGILQYRRISVYFDQKEMSRYGNTVEIVERLKKEKREEEEKK
ncbi:hypothetical protein [Enterococcus faecalis]|uniref:hypothetical protein n=1 Tax=Enterococcus faecalis TaxID=1351 RepID=UPI00136ED5C1|nr:hypothetical protein [Enterococcus faecalis]NAA54084.1 hypothetical protein [Enterococcus faecalis]